MWNKTEEKLPEQNKLVLCYWTGDKETALRLCYLNEQNEWIHPLNSQDGVKCSIGGTMKHDFDDYPEAQYAICYFVVGGRNCVTPPKYWHYLPERPE